jgi:hypothetical protein
MKPAWLALLVLAGCGGGTSTSSSSDGPQLALAQGDLPGAEAALRGAQDPESRWMLARLLLMRNRPAEAADILSRLTGKVSSVTEAFLLQSVWMDLAAARMRQDDWAGASQAWAKLGDPVLARKCELLARSGAYRIAAGWTDSILELQAVDPLPLVSARVNGREGLFVVDTGGGETVLDRTFAKRAGVTAIGVQGGGAAEEAVLDELSLGRLVVKSVPAQIGEVAARGTLKPDGAIGLAFLLHFDVTLDFRRLRLFLRKPGEPAAPSAVPAYVAGDRYLLVGGKVNGTLDTLVGLHTGIAGLVAAPSESFLRIHNTTLQSVAAGPLSVAKPPLSPAAFPLGLDGSFGFPVGVVLGPVALRGRSLRLEPRAMKIELQ